MKQYIIGTVPRVMQGQIPVKVHDEKMHVSRNHCKLTVYNDSIVIEDLGSLNGTLVDGIRINTPTEVTIHSQILLAGEIPFSIAEFLHLPEKQSVSPPKENNKNEFFLRSDIAYAGFFQRFVGCMLDGIIIGIPFSILITMIRIIIPLAPIAWLIQIAVLLAIIHFYFVEPISKRGITAGRKIMKIEYLGADTLDYPTKEKVWLRTIAYSLSSILLGIGFLLPLFTEKKQALHDLLANTIVVAKK